MPLGRVMILGIPLVLGFGFLAAGTHTYVEQTDAIEAAEPVEVEVLDTEIERERRSSDSGSRYKYTPVVEYRYEIDGETYTSDTVYPGGISQSESSRSAAEDEISDFVPGETAAGYAAPDSPEVSYLIDMSPREIAFRSSIFGVVGSVIFLAGLIANLRWAARVDK